MANDLGQYIQKLDPWATGIMRGADYNDGWLEVQDTWTYVDASTVEIDGDFVDLYPVGCKIRWTQTTVKYAYCTAASLNLGKTRLTLNGGTDYTVANAAITDPAVSYASNPRDFPHWFDYTPTWTSSSGADPAIGDGNLYGKFCIVGRLLYFHIRAVMGSTTTFGGGDWRWGLPLTVPTSSTGAKLIQGMSRDSSASLIYTHFPNLGLITGPVTYINGYYDTAAPGAALVWNATTPFTWASGDIFVLNGDCEI